MTIVITLCIFSILLHFTCIFITILLLSRLIGRAPVSSPIPGAQANESKAPALDPAAEERARQKQEAEMAAFEELMSYNADVAYGTLPSEE